MVDVSLIYNEYFGDAIPDRSIGEVLAEVEYGLMTAALARFNTIEEAAQSLGIHRNTFANRYKYLKYTKFKDVKPADEPISVWDHNPFAPYIAEKEDGEISS